jgi:DNA-binding winged helix-turn-helix (wHTH) protein/TolB-like protein/Tfp pilus assembly protein PilF
MSRQAKHFYEFGRFRVDEEEHRLLREGEAVPLPPKAFETLLALVRNSGHLLTKDELLQTVWPDTFVEENNLKQYISVLRKILGTNSDGNGYIETVARVGYRFAAGVQEVWDEGEAILVENQARYRIVVNQEEREEIEGDEQMVEARPMPVALPEPQRRWELRHVLMAAVVLLGLAVVLLLLASRGGRNATNVGNKPIAFKSIAVLPFKSIGGNSDNEHLGLGMADTLIAKLSHIQRINIRPISAVYRFTDLEQDPLAAGRALGVDAVLDGRIQRADGRIRVTVELLSVSDGAVLWTETLDEESVDIFTLQDQIAGHVARSLPSALTSEERALLAKNYTTNPAAYDAYLRGRFFWNKRNEEGFTKAIEYFRQAIRVDPNYAQAHAGLADCYALLSEYSSVRPSETTPRAKEAALKALELDDTLAEAHTSLAYVLANYEWDFPRAEREFKRAIELNPSYATTHQWYAELLLILRRFDEALVEIRQAQELDPLSLIVNGVAASILTHAGQYDQADELLQRTLELEPNFVAAHAYLAHVYEGKGMYEEALAELQKARDLTGSRISIFNLARVYALWGKRSEARRELGELRELSKRQYVPAYDLAQIYALLGERDRAFEELQRSYEEHYRFLIFLNVDPSFDGLHSDPRFIALLRRMNLAS